jgi:Rps23 Pro-64 3,4-dihydroxylase Tpa1-like proline 4-hydroxylase
MLNRDLNIPSLNRAYSQNGALSIQNILEPGVARELHDALVKLDWVLEISDYDQSGKLRVPRRELKKPDDLLSALDTVPHNLNRNNLFFMRLCVEDNYLNQPALTGLSQFLKSDEFLDVFRKITGRKEIAHLWLEATCYDKCCFLGGHKDDHHADNLVAFVLNLTPRWQVDWGGLLMLLFPNMPPTIVPPMWNSLSIFNVPVDHLVSCVSPAAAEKRYSITGWFRR